MIKMIVPPTPGAPAFRVLCGGWGTYHAVLFLDEGSEPYFPGLHKLRGKAGPPMNLLRRGRYRRLGLIGAETQ